MKNICKYTYQYQDLELVLLKHRWALCIDEDPIVQRTKENRTKQTSKQKKLFVQRVYSVKKDNRTDG